MPIYKLTGDKIDGINIHIKALRAFAFHISGISMAESARGKEIEIALLEESLYWLKKSNEKIKTFTSEKQES